MLLFSSAGSSVLSLFSHEPFSDALSLARAVFATWQRNDLHVGEKPMVHSIHRRFYDCIAQGRCIKNTLQGNPKKTLDSPIAISTSVESRAAVANLLLTCLENRVVRSPLASGKGWGNKVVRFRLEIWK